MPTTTSSSRSTRQGAYVIFFILIVVSRNHPCHCTDDRVIRERRTLLGDDAADLKLGHDHVKRLPNPITTTTIKPAIVSNDKPTSTTEKPPTHTTTGAPKPIVHPVAPKPNVTTAFEPPKSPPVTEKATKPYVPITAAPTTSTTTLGTTARIAIHKEITTSRPNAAIFAAKTTVRPVPSTTAEPPLGTYWDGWNELLTSRFWEKRYKDHEYLLQLSLPIVIGIGAASVFALFICISQCLCSLKKTRRLKRKKKMYFDKEGSDKWMLLEKASSSDEDAV